MGCATTVHGSRLFKDAFAGLLPPPLGGSLVGPYGHRAVASDLHDDLLINIVLVKFCGRCRAKGMVGVVTRKASCVTHGSDSRAKLVEANWSVLCLSEELFLWL